MDFGSLASKKHMEEKIKARIGEKGKDQEWIKARVYAWELQGTC
jgi:hypothetical protein